jgi:threonine/homoserine/homoserine lactone efflux protein
MTFGGRLIFTGVRVVFVTTPWPNAVNCIGNGMVPGFRRALRGVAGILVRAVLFLLLSAAGVTALLLAAPGAFPVAKTIGAAFPVYPDLRGRINAAPPVETAHVSARHVYGKAFMITTIGYTEYYAIGAGPGRAAMGTVFNTWFRRLMAPGFIGIGLVSGGASLSNTGR